MKPGGPFKLDDRRPYYLLGAALLLLGAGLGVEFSRRGGSQPPLRTLRPRVVLPTTLGPDPGGAAPPSSSLPRPRHRFADLLAALAPLAGRPLAEEFAERFLKNPELRRLWEEFQKTGDLQAFLEKLRKSPAFAELAREFSQKPGFPELAEQAANDPKVASEVGEFLQAMAESSASAPAPAAPALSRMDSFSGRAGADKVFHALIESVPTAFRSPILQRLEAGDTFPKACASSGLSTCPTLVERCAADPACAKRLSPTKPLVRAGPTRPGTTTGGGPTPTSGGGETGGEDSTGGSSGGTTVAATNGGPPPRIQPDLGDTEGTMDDAPLEFSCPAGCNMMMGSCMCDGSDGSCGTGCTWSPAWQMCKCQAQDQNGMPYSQKEVLRATGALEPKGVGAPRRSPAPTPATRPRGRTPPAQP